MIEPLKYLSEAKLAELRKSVNAHLTRYEWGDFADLVVDNGWAIESTDVKVDTELLAQLNESLSQPQQDAEASIIVYQALQGMTPAMAAEERVWTRLTHVECLAYSQARWIRTSEDEELLKAIRKHMFASGVQGIRDDNALSRLWWNMHIATIADPADPQGALRLMLRRADTRMSFVERTNTGSRGTIARAVIRAMRAHEWLQSSEGAFRHFMIVLNREGGGVLFESLTDAEADACMERCVQMAEERANAAA